MKTTLGRNCFSVSPVCCTSEKTTTPWKQVGDISSTSVKFLQQANRWIGSGVLIIERMRERRFFDSRSFKVLLHVWKKLQHHENRLAIFPTFFQKFSSASEQVNTFCTARVMRIQSMRETNVPVVGASKFCCTSANRWFQNSICSIGGMREAIQNCGLNFNKPFEIKSTFKLHSRVFKVLEVIRFTDEEDWKELTFTKTAKTTNIKRFTSFKRGRSSTTPLSTGNTNWKLEFWKSPVFSDVQQNF